MGEIKPPHPRPCKSCPYRKDAPSGMWHVDEYNVLARFDKPMDEAPTSVFMCHQDDDSLCAGWVGTHDMENLLGPRIRVLEGEMSVETLKAVFEYKTPVPLFESGAAARDHGLRDYWSPSAEARKAIRDLERRRDDVR